MQDYGWSALRAWRECHRLSRAEVANQLDLTLNTYNLLELAVIPLCEWTGPFIESRLCINWSLTRAQAVRK